MKRALAFGLTTGIVVTAIAYAWIVSTEKKLYQDFGY